MSSNEELKSGDLWKFSSCLSRVVAAEQGPTEPTDFSVLDKIQGDDDGLIFTPSKPPALPKEIFEKLFGVVEGRLRLQEYRPMIMLSNRAESLVKDTYGPDEVKLIMLGVHMASAAMVDHAQMQEFQEQLPDFPEG